MPDIWHLRGKPLAAQSEYLSRSQGRPKYGNFMDMGLGKTACALNEFIGSGLNRLAVLCPNRLKGTWLEAIEEWTLIDKNNVCIWPAPIGVRHVVLIMNYEAILNHCDKLVDFLRGTQTFMVIDEGHRIKNFNAKITKMVMAAANNAEIRRELTGTPMTNNVMDLWSQFRFLGELDGVNPYAFRNRFAVMGGWMGKQVMGVKPEKMDELQTILNRCSFRARKEDWADLPMKIYPSPHQFDMTGEQIKLYRGMLEDFMVEIGREEISADMVISQLLKLQQISRGFAMNEGRAIDVMPAEQNPTIRVVLDMLTDIKGKTVIFCHFRHSTIALADTLEREGFEPAVLISGVERYDMDEQRIRFNEDPACRVAVVQSATGSLGLTLLGAGGEDRCATTIFYENSYSLGTRRQAEDRNHRYGQDKPVVYIDLCCSPIDRAIIVALQKKNDLVAAVVDAVRVARTPGTVL
jgi:SNF2 family DNA or RNA helicase